MIENNNPKQTITVSELNNYIKLLFDNTTTLQNIYLHGEISNYFGKNRSGHIYFSLKDETCSIKAVMFKFDTNSLDFEPKNGDDVIVHGSVSSYPPNGTYQIIVKKIELFGQGSILLKKEKLKEKLDKEGYFLVEHKKQLPLYPKTIGIITGKNSAACADMITNIFRRYPLVDINVYYSLVQGQEASKDLIKTLHKAEKDNLDLIIIGRGGGSVEDLNAFDDEMLAKELYKCKIPTISAIGHEINRSICDYISDKYVSTPTGAAEAAVPNKDDLIEELGQTKSYLNTLINNKLESCQNKLLNIKNNKNIINISNTYDRMEHNLIDIKTKIDNIIKSNLDNKNNEIKLKSKLIDAFNPNNLLKKGYAMVFNSNNKIISSKNQINVDDDVTIRISDGSIKAKIKSK